MLSRPYISLMQMEIDKGAQVAMTTLAAAEM
jgi:hypothetical protein